MQGTAKYLPVGCWAIKLPCTPTIWKMFDGNGELYHYRYLDGHTETVNVNVVQPGNYYFEGVVVERKPLNYTGFNIDLPTAERFRLKPIRVVYNRNLRDTPARIFTEIGLIEISPSFYRLTPQIRLFVLLHEYGHLFYKTEWKTDTFACKMFLQMGYNPSQALYALTEVLGWTPQNAERILIMFKNLKND